MPTPRNHHTVPQFLLKYFSIDSNERQVYAFDKSDCRSFPLAIHNAAAERDFYRAEIGGQAVNFEPAFQFVDDLGSDILGRLVRSINPVVLDARTFAELPAIAAAQLLRTKLQRTTPQELANQLQERSRAVGLEIETALADDSARRIALFRLMDSGEAESSFRTKDVLLLETSGDHRFWISDNPVVMFNTFPYGRVGLSAPGIEIYFPISPTRALGFFCPSIRKQIAESLNPAHPRRRLVNPIYTEMLRAVEDRSTLNVSDDYVAFLNELQVRQSTRFLYSDTNEFDFARTILDVQPELADVRSLFVIGEMGAGHPMNPEMPLGEWLVVESGTNHHAIPVRTLTPPNPAYIEFEPLDHVKLGVALEDAPFDSATLYSDRSEVRGMRGVEFSLLERDGRRVVRAQHSDPGIRRLMDRLTTDQDTSDQVR